MGRRTMGHGRARWATAVLAAVIALAAGARRAHAEEPAVALLMDAPGRAEIGRELLVALAERHARVVAGDAPVGDTPLVRAAVAQRMARGLGATLALWIEPGTRGSEVRAVLVDGNALSRAPLPGVVEALEPRVVATVAASLVDELWGVVAEATEATEAPEATEATEEAPAPTDAAPAQLTVEIRVDPAPEATDAEPGPRRPAMTDGADAADASVAQVAPATAAEAPRWSIGLGDALHADGPDNLELRVTRLAPSRWYAGGWATFGFARSGSGYTPDLGLGLDLGLTTGGDTFWSYGLFTGASFVGVADVPTSDLAIGSRGTTGGLDALLLGARGGLVLGLTQHLAVRIELSAAAETTAFHGTGLVSWLSLLVEVRQ
jgi:hypothetical protein